MADNLSANQNLFSETEIQEIFDKDILEIMGATNLPEEKKQELYEKMLATVQDRVLLRIDDQLDDASRQEWAQAIDSGDQAQAEAFLKSKNIDVAKLLVEEALAYKTTIAAMMKISKE